MKLELSIEDEIKDVKCGRPHVVILGAGASLAAFPTGDANGVVLPLMCDFIEKVGLENDLSKYKVDFKGQNLKKYIVIYTKRMNIKA